MGSIYLKKKLQSSIFKLMFEPFFILLGNLEMANNFSLKFLPFKLKTAEILEINNLPYLDFSNSVFDPPPFVDHLVNSTKIGMFIST